MTGRRPTATLYARKWELQFPWWDRHLRLPPERRSIRQRSGDRRVPQRLPRQHQSDSTVRPSSLLAHRVAPSARDDRPCLHDGDRTIGSAGHVDLTEVQNGHAADPLAPATSRLTRTGRIRSLRASACRATTPQRLVPNYVTGTVGLVADVQSTSRRCPYPATGTGRRSRLRSRAGESGTERNGRVPTRVAADFRTNVPGNDAFWSLMHARHSFQNMNCSRQPFRTCSRAATCSCCRRRSSTRISARRGVRRRGDGDRRPRQFQLSLASLYDPQRID